MGRAPFTTPVSPEAIRIAVRAYDAGHRLVAKWINETLQDWRIDLRLDVKPPIDDFTFESCRRALSNSLHAYRAMAPDLEPDGKLRPWLIALYVHVDGRKIAKCITLYEDSVPQSLNWTDEQYWRSDIGNFVGVKHAMGWREKEFQENVIEPVTANAADWIRWLRLKKAPVHGKVPVAETARVQLFDQDEAPWVDGKEQKPLTAAQYEIVLELVKAAPDRLNKDQIEDIRPGARRTLRDLAKSSPQWNRVLHFGKTKGRGYGVKG